MADRFGLDTNILLRFVHGDAQSPLVVDAMLKLHNAGSKFYLTPQNIGEFWNVSTRPADKNGFGLSARETVIKIDELEQSMTVLPDDAQVYVIWRRLLIDESIRGVRVHDAHLAASLEAHDINHLLTLNTADFKRFSYLTVLHPRDV